MPPGRRLMKLSALFLTLIITFVLFLPFKAESEWLYFNTDNGILENDFINCLAIGPDNKKWFGTYYQGPTFGLIFRFDEDSLWEFYLPANNDMGTSSVIAVAAGSDGYLWLGTQTGGLVRYDGFSEWIRYDLDTALQYLRNVSSLAIDTAGNVWVGTLGSGVGRLSPDSIWSRFDTANSPLVSNQIVSLFADRYGEVWIGTFAGMNRFSEVGGWTTYDSSNSGLPDNTIRCFELDAAGRLWIGTNQGLALYDRQGGWQNFDTANSGIAYNQVDDIIIDSSGYLWLAHPYPADSPTEIPVSRFDGFDSWQSYNLDHFPNTWYVSVNEMAVDKGGNIWFATNGEGIFCLKKDPTGIADGSADFTPRDFQLHQNYPNPFNRGTIIEFSVAARSHITLEIFDLLGTRVGTLIESVYPVGRHRVSWDGLDADGKSVASGLYFYRLTSDRAAAAGKMLLLK